MGTQQQKQLSVIVIGDSCTDIYEFGSCHRLSPEAPVPIFKRRTVDSRPGMSLNVTENLRALGVNVHLITNEEKILKTRLIDEISGYQLVRIDDEPDIKPFKGGNLSSGLLSSFSAIVISDYDKGFIRHSSISEIVEKCNQISIPVFVDSKKSDLSCFPGCIIKLNNTEHKNVKKFPEKYDLVVTLGKGGAMWNNNLFPAVETEVFDVCGAGDTFLAAFVYMHILTKDYDKSITFANKHASDAVRARGTYVIPEEAT